MLPIQLAGLSLAGTMVFSNKNFRSSLSKSLLRLKQTPAPKRMKFQTSTMGNPIQALVRGLTSTLSQITKKTAKEDYTPVIRSFLPKGAKLLVPKYSLSNSETLHSDLDGDSQNELVATFKLNADIRTIVLKKRNEQWYKAAEINNPGYGSFNYRTSADIAGDGKNHLLLGLESEGKTPMIHAYSLENGSMKKLFERNYHRFDMFTHQSEDGSPAIKNLAFWDQKEVDTYDVQILRWNGQQLEPVKNIAPYYNSKVIPYYTSKLRQAPLNPSTWYYLADALVKTGAYQNAQIVINEGMKYDLKSVYREKFNELSSKILKDSK